MIPFLSPEAPFPSPERALTQPNGLLAAGGALSPTTLLRAYQQGIFPWYSAGQPILWWSPDPRMVLYTDELHLSRALVKVRRNRPWRVTFDTDFPAVMRACAAMPRPGQDGTWITPQMIATYTELHRLGYAHSVETWMEGERVGGLYGVAIGRMFYGESMFSLRPDASKLALVCLAEHLQQAGFLLIDCQIYTPHLARMGGRLIPRASFLQHLATATQQEAPAGLWEKEFAHDPSCP